MSRYYSIDIISETQIHASRLVIIYHDRHKNKVKKSSEKKRKDFMIVMESEMNIYSIYYELNLFCIYYITLIYRAGNTRRKKRFWGW